MLPDLSGLAVMAAVGIVCALAILVPAASAAVAIVVWRVVSTDWSLAAAYIGAGVGLIPGIIILAGIAGTFVSDARR
jgi:hypothetical protein